MYKLTKKFVKNPREIWSHVNMDYKQATPNIILLSDQGFERRNAAHIG